MPTPSGTPDERVQHAMVHDGARSQVVLFGGLYTQGGAVTGDTWIYRR